MKYAVLFLVVASSAAGCSKVVKDRISFDGQYFRSSASKQGDDRRDFKVSVRPVSASLNGAREAARFEATKYCVSTFGNSEKTWVIGPDDDPATYTIEGDVLVLTGACKG